MSALPIMEGMEEPAEHRHVRMADQGEIKEMMEIQEEMVQTELTELLDLPELSAAMVPREPT
jgi:hypothetical protein